MVHVDHVARSTSSQLPVRPKLLLCHLVLHRSVLPSASSVEVIEPRSFGRRQSVMWLASTSPPLASPLPVKMYPEILFERTTKKFLKLPRKQSETDVNYM
ncbi:Os06g0306550 [Oryza sativa Japonica Group]|uniref:Os06g0306550 protein n=1 Tax=Oryza sativa subsp. japonica TaxID=39947 RepID=A0A0P0WVM3_ORYSJ|nr:Os06g0306550 [Oryza sativa Japonica Group]